MSVRIRELSEFRAAVERAIGFADEHLSRPREKQPRQAPRSRSSPVVRTGPEDTTPPWLDLPKPDVSKSGAEFNEFERLPHAEAN